MILSTIVLVPTLALTVIGAPLINLQKAHAEQTAAASVEKRADDHGGIWYVEKRADENGGIWSVEKREDENEGIWSVEKREDENSGIWSVEKRAPLAARLEQPGSPKPQTWRLDA